MSAKRILLRGFPHWNQSHWCHLSYLTENEFLTRLWKCLLHQKWRKSLCSKSLEKVHLTQGERPPLPGVKLPPQRENSLSQKESLCFKEESLWHKEESFRLKEKSIFLGTYQGCWIGGGRTLAWMTMGTCQGCWLGGGRTLAWMTLGTCQGCWLGGGRTLAWMTLGTCQSFRLVGGL